MDPPLAKDAKDGAPAAGVAPAKIGRSLIWFGITKGLADFFRNRFSPRGFLIIPKMELGRLNLTLNDLKTAKV
jgi:hypothetical protein